MLSTIEESQNLPLVKRTKPSNSIDYFKALFVFNGDNFISTIFNIEMENLNKIISESKNPDIGGFRERVAANERMNSAIALFSKKVVNEKFAKVIQDILEEKNVKTMENIFEDNDEEIFNDIVDTLTELANVTIANKEDRMKQLADALDFFPPPRIQSLILPTPNLPTVYQQPLTKLPGFRKFHPINVRRETRNSLLARINRPLSQLPTSRTFKQITIKRETIASLLQRISASIPSPPAVIPSPPPVVIPPPLSKLPRFRKFATVPVKREPNRRLESRIHVSTSPSVPPPTTPPSAPPSAPPTTPPSAPIQGAALSELPKSVEFKAFSVIRETIPSLLNRIHRVENLGELPGSKSFFHVSVKRETIPSLLNRIHREEKHSDLPGSRSFTPVPVKRETNASLLNRISKLEFKNQVQFPDFENEDPDFFGDFPFDFLKQALDGFVNRIFEKNTNV